MRLPAQAAPNRPVSGVSWAASRRQGPAGPDPSRQNPRPAPTGRPDRRAGGAGGEAGRAGRRGRRPESGLMGGTYLCARHPDHLLHRAEHQEVLGLHRHHHFLALLDQLGRCVRHPQSYSCSGLGQQQHVQQPWTCHKSDVSVFRVLPACQGFPVGWVWWLTIVLCTAMMAGVGELMCYYCRDLKEMEVDH